MHPARATRLIAVGLALASSVIAGATDPTFHWIEPRPGHILSYATGVSDDGRYVSGWSAVDESLTNPVGFRWSIEGGREEYGTTERPYGQALGISADGTTVAGYDSTPGPFNQLANRRRGPGGGPESVGVLPNYTNARALRANADGSMVLGNSSRGSGLGRESQPFRWTAEGGMQPLGFLQPDGYDSEMTGASNDGRTVIGTSQARSAPGTYQAFVWREGIGYSNLTYPLPDGGTGTAGFADAISADGSAVISYRYVANRPEMIRWTNAADPLVVGRPSEFRACTARDVALNGRMVVFQANSRIGGGSDETAYVWVERDGFSPLVDYLRGHGVPLSAQTTLIDCFAVTPDGMTFVGIGGGQDGRLLGFVATIPAPPSGAMLASLSYFVCRRERRRMPMPDRG